MPVPVGLVVAGTVASVAIPTAVMGWGVWEGKKASKKGESLSSEMMKRNEKYQMYGLILAVIGVIISVITIIMMYKDRK